MIANGHRRFTKLASIAVLCVSALMALAIFVAKADAQSPAESAAAQTEDATQVRVRELIYILRQHRVFDRTDEWGGAIRELAKIGQPALPELLLELNSTERGMTLRGLLFTLRAIDDPRAIPFVIEALPKAERFSRSGSDCGLNFADPDLEQFMKRNQNYPRDDGEKGGDDYVSYGRPINEIIGTLHKLSRTKPPDLSKTIKPSWRAAYWRDWWKANQTSDVPTKKDETCQLAPRKEDLVERDGVRKFGPLFPTGDGQYLSPVADVRLEYNSLADALSALDFDTGRLYEYFEGMHFKPEQKRERTDSMKWQTQCGIDLDVNGGHDLYLWRIDNSRWDSLDAEVKSSKPFDIGKEASSIWSFANNPQVGQVGTFLFTTREGARGVLRAYWPPPGGPTHFEYRLWNRQANAIAARPAALPGERGEWRPEKIVILKEPGFGNRCLFDLKKGEGEVLPAALFAPDQPPDMSEFLKKHGTIFNDVQIAKWARGRGVDIASHRTRYINEGNARPPEQVGQLTMLDARVVQVTSGAFNNLTIARAKELLARSPDEFRVDYISTSRNAGTAPAAYVFKTKSGLIGLIKIINVSENLSVSFQYKLAAGMKQDASDAR